MTGVIYKIISPSGKIYIGQTRSVKRRKWHYKRAKCESQIKLFHSILKYGWEQHLFEIIENIEHEFDCLQILDACEIYWINFYDSINSGLNILPGGGGRKNIKHSEDAKRKISEAHKGRVHSEEVRKNMGAPKGFKHTDEAKEKISKALTERKIKPETLEKLRKAKIGFKHSEETKALIREKRKNQIISEETKQKIRNTLKNKYNEGN